MVLTKLNPILQGMVIIFGSLALWLVIPNSTVLAHDGEEHPEEAVTIETESTPVFTYDYVAQPGDSLTKMVRKSVQLFDAQQPEVELNEGQIIFMETNITQALGSKRLAIGERVSVPEDLIEKYAGEIGAITPPQQEAWDCYAQTATFDLPHIVPVSDPQVQAQAIDDQAATDTATDFQAASNEPSPNLWYWWVIGGATVVALWYLLWRRAKETDTEIK